MNEFLTARLFMHDRVNAGIDVHLSDEDAKEFQMLAKQIDKDKYFTIYGCQSCINTLVKFVFDNQNTLVKKETFPKHAEKSSTKEANKA